MEEIAMKWLKWIAIALGVLLIVPMVTLLVLGHRADAGRVQAAIEIAAPPEQVWTWIDDGDKLKQWVSWLVEVQYPDPHNAHGAGATRVMVMKDENNGGMLMRIVGKCREYTPPSRMAIALSDTDGVFNGDQTYQLKDMGNGHTRLEVRGSYHFSQWFANLMEPLIIPQATKKMMADVAHLKTLVESKAELR
jgi:uncharacterized protein YndB with AHSA1/START domain